MPTFNVELSTSSVSKLIQHLKSYQKELSGKNALFVQRLGKAGIPVIDSTIARTRGDANPSHRAYVKMNSSTGSVANCSLVLEGEEILFFEFGAGIYYNSSDPPHAKKFGYGVGTYPDQKHAFDDNGWWYTDEIGTPHHSFGTEATSPMLHASHEIIAKVRRIAREVYGS